MCYCEVLFIHPATYSMYIGHVFPRKMKAPSSHLPPGRHNLLAGTFALPRVHRLVSGMTLLVPQWGFVAMKNSRDCSITRFLQPHPAKFAKVVTEGGVAVSARRVTCVAPHESLSPELDGFSDSARKDGVVGNGGGILVAGEVLQSLGDDQVRRSEGRSDQLSKEQEIRMELNRAAACAKRNQRLCEERLAEAKAGGVQLRFGDLLVEKGWCDVLGGELQKPYMENLFEFVRQEGRGQVPVYPPPAKVFNAFNSCPFDKVKVVIIGQDPYHGPGQAMGLSFSVPEGVKVPSSLLNIYKEINQDLGCSIPTHGNLEKWTYQGVLLLNAVLTVRGGHANSHSKKGWEPFTDAAIRAISKNKEGVVFLLWGNFAQEKTRLINTSVHHVLKAAHPSGLSAHKGFFNCRHFSKANTLLQEAGKLPIDWQL